MNIVIFGPPGAGKGTQSNFIVEKFKLHQLSTGEILRNEIKNKTKLGQQIESIINSGNLVSDEIVSDLIENYISNDDYKNRLIFDGYPRNLVQVKNLENLLKKNDQKIDIVLKLSVSLETIKKRISERKTLEQRADDSEKIAIRRYEMYEKNIEPVIDFYNQSNLLIVVNGEKPISKISDEISGLIEGIKG
jgi:adenylate kinase